MNFIRLDGQLVNLDAVAVIVPESKNQCRAYFNGGEFHYVSIYESFRTVCERIAEMEARKNGI